MSYIFTDTLCGKQTERPPVWFMRQAGRVLPNYNALRQTASFHQIMSTPELAAKVTIMPVTDIGVDAAILFNDILTIPTAMGMDLDWSTGAPRFATPLHTLDNASASLKPDPSMLTHAYDAIKATKSMSDSPLIGFCGAPLTTLCYMLQGNSAKHDFPEAKRYMFNNKEQMRKLVDAVTELSIEYALGQVKCGIDAFQLFDTHAGLVPFEYFKEMFLPAVRKIADAVRSQGVQFIYFPKGLGMGLSCVTPDVCDFVSVDWQTSIAEARKTLHPNVGIQGNLDPSVLFADKKEIQQIMENVYRPFFHENNKWIFNLGHGVMANTPLENLQYLTQWIKNSENWK